MYEVTWPFDCYEVIVITLLLWFYCCQLIELSVHCAWLVLLESMQHNYLATNLARMAKHGNNGASAIELVWE